MQRAEIPDRLGHRMVGRQRLGRRRADVPAAVVLGVVLEEVVVAASEDRRAQRVTERELVARIVDARKVIMRLRTSRVP